MSFGGGGSQQPVIKPSPVPQRAEIEPTVVSEQERKRRAGGTLLSRGKLTESADIFAPVLKTTLGE
jgi:hypothetical protein